jgi:hypothetical protein
MHALTNRNLTPAGVNFINVSSKAFFVQNFVQSQNVARKKAFVQKIRAKNVGDEIDARLPLSLLLKSFEDLSGTFFDLRTNISTTAVSTILLFMLLC